LRLGARLRETVDSGDILQETFMAAVRSLDSFEMREEASLINWLSRLAERQIIAAADYHGAKKRDQQRNVSLQGPTSLTSTRTATISFADETTGPLEKLAAREQTDVVEGCLDQ